MKTLAQLLRTDNDAATQYLTSQIQALSPSDKGRLIAMVALDGKLDYKTFLAKGKQRPMVLAHMFHAATYGFENGKANAKTAKRLINKHAREFMYDQSGMSALLSTCLELAASEGRTSGQQSPFVQLCRVYKHSPMFQYALVDAGDFENLVWTKDVVREILQEAPAITISSHLRALLSLGIRHQLFEEVMEYVNRFGKDLPVNKKKNKKAQESIAKERELATLHALRTLAYSFHFFAEELRLLKRSHGHSSYLSAFHSHDGHGDIPPYEPSGEDLREAAQEVLQRREMRKAGSGFRDMEDFTFVDRDAHAELETAMEKRKLAAEIHAHHGLEGYLRRREQKSASEAPSFPRKLSQAWTLEDDESPLFDALLLDFSSLLQDGLERPGTPLTPDAVGLGILGFCVVTGSSHLLPAIAHSLLDPLVRGETSHKLSMVGYRALLDTCLHFGQLQAAVSILSLLYHHGIEFHTEVYNTVAGGVAVAGTPIMLAVLLIHKSDALLHAPSHSEDAEPWWLLVESDMLKETVRLLHHFQEDQVIQELVGFLIRQDVIVPNQVLREVEMLANSSPSEITGSTDMEGSVSRRALGLLSSGLQVSLLTSMIGPTAQAQRDQIDAQVHDEALSGLLKPYFGQPLRMASAQQGSVSDDAATIRSLNSVVGAVNIATLQARSLAEWQRVVQEYCKPKE